MEKRVLGKTGEKLSIIGFGGIVVSQMEQSDANNIVAEAIDRGVNYFDVAPTYGDAQDRLGPALVGKRNSIFLACKTGERSREKAKEELYTSFEKLKTDHFDLYQLHGIDSPEEIKQALGPNGALETFMRAREEGLVRYLGFTCHSEEAALTLMEQFDFDTVLFPINWVCVLKNNYGMKVLEKAGEKGMGRFAMKSMAKTDWPEGVEKDYPKCWYQPIDNKDIARLAYRFALSQNVTAAVPPGDIRLFRTALETAENFSPITSQEIEQLKSYAEGVKPLFPLKEQ